MALYHSMSPQLENDIKLLPYPTYEKYLDSLLSDLDRCFLKGTNAADQFAALGYRSTGETLSKKDFEKRREAVQRFLHPTYMPYVLASEDTYGQDPIHVELAKREHGNRLGHLATIVYLRYISGQGHEVSGYLDYAERLRIDDWREFFEGKTLIRPRITDLGFYHWKSGKSHTNHSENYKTRIDGNFGLCFQHRFDRKFVYALPHKDPGHNTVRVRCVSQLYQYVVFFDHYVRQRV